MGLHSQCKPCRVKKSLEIYHSKKKLNSKRKTYITKNNKDIATELTWSEFKLSLRIYVDELKIKSGCKDCGNTYPKEPWLLEFDHLDGSQKSFSISQAINATKDLEIIKNEINKCEIVCVLCHRRRTAKRANFSNKHLNYKKER